MEYINNLVEDGKMDRAMKWARRDESRNRTRRKNTNSFIKGWCKVGKMSVAMHVDEGDVENGNIS